MQYKVGDIVEILNTKDFSEGDPKHWISRNRSYDVKINYVGHRFRVSSIENDGTLHFEGGGWAAPSSVMLYSRETCKLKELIKKTDNTSNVLNTKPEYYYNTTDRCNNCGKLYYRGVLPVNAEDCCSCPNQNT